MAVSRLLPLLAGIIVCFAAKSDQHAVSRFMQKAKEHFDAGNLQAAEQSLRDALTIEPNNAKVLIYCFSTHFNSPLLQALHRLFDLVCRANNGDEAERLEPLLLRAMPPQTNPHVYLILAGCFKVFYCPIVHFHRVLGLALQIHGAVAAVLSIIQRLGCVGCCAAFRIRFHCRNEPSCAASKIVFARGPRRGRAADAGWLRAQARSGRPEISTGHAFDVARTRELCVGSLARL